MEDQTYTKEICSECGSIIVSARDHISCDIHKEDKEQDAKSS